ncbi:hypothetical protein F5890DRAFT_783764 [Lentinula detonsa]|uniref:Fungal N-terminal domain-containing protein n=1 Tax=Lentinula detonsa TaxID=2804962 RepID=A0AA38UUW0_9AGAR|nr:hypothetical protein F5890DRAFT_783764 [Lentinula detonsa]
MAEIFALVSTTVSIAFQIKSITEQIQYNREAHRLLVNRITTSLMQLKAESRKLTKSSPGLTLVVSKLKSSLERILEKCKDSESHKPGFGVKLREWFSKDSIRTALQEVETQLSYCLQEFGALGTVRIERKLGDHNTEVNRKLDELLRRTPARARYSINHSPTVNRNLAHTPIAVPLQTRTASGSSTNSSVTAPEVSNGSRKSFTSKMMLSPPSLSSSVHHEKKASPLERSLQSNLVLYSEKPTPKEAFFAHRQPRSMGFFSSIRSESSISSITQPSINAHILYEHQANELDSECKRLRSIKHLSEALIPGRKAVSLRRMSYAADKSVTATAALARSLTYLARCLKDIHVDSHFTGTKVSAELTAVLSESVELYKVAFKEDKACRIDLATALYNLSVRQSEPQKINASSSSLNTHIVLAKSQRSRSLTFALASAEEAVHHFTVLEKEDPDAFGMDLANALLNLSFILSDIESHEEALTISRKAVMLAYRLTSTDPHTQERARHIRTLHKALMRVSFCLDNLGRTSEAQEAETEASDILKKPFFTDGF